MYKCIDAFQPYAEQFEGNIAWPYLDNDTHGNVTVGIGCQISLSQALTLPFSIGAYTAPSSQIQQNYQKVQGMRAGMRASFYEYMGCLTLSQDARTALYQERCTEFVNKLIGVFVDFISWPMLAQLATLNMIFELGDERLFEEYPNWKLAVAQKDWIGAARECAIDADDPSFDARNQWMQECFMHASPVV